MPQFMLHKEKLETAVNRGVGAGGFGDQMFFVGEIVHGGPFCIDMQIWKYGQLLGS